MRIAISGSNGLIGSSLLKAFQSNGHEILRFVRSSQVIRAPDIITYNPAAHFIETEKLEGLDVVINLAGENIASGRWTIARKQVILDSRISTTKLLVGAIQQVSRKPKLFLNASAIGFYGANETNDLDERNSRGIGFLSQVCLDWEKEAFRLTKSDVRTVCLRFGVVLSDKGGMLTKLLPLFRMGLGGQTGNGLQGFSWIALSEIYEIVSFLIAHTNIQGPVNCCSPEPVSNAEFSRTLARVLGKPCFCHVPAWLIKTMLGEMGQELILSGAKVLPNQLLSAGYRFQYSKLENALADLINKP